MNVLICCDEEDPTVGHFVELCADKAHEIVDDIDISVEGLNSAQLSADSIAELANQNGDTPFVCAAFSHGSDDALLCKSGDYISVDANQNSFKNVFFYTWACSTANNLGQVLIDSRCKTYIGYLEPVSVPELGDESLEIFVECAVKGLRVFWEDGISAVRAFNAMRDFYDEKIDELRFDDPIAAGHLNTHSMVLDILGNESVTRESLFNTTSP